MTEHGIFREAEDLEIILASASPRRIELLSSLGLGFSVQPAPGAEPEPMPGEEAAQYCIRAASAKAESAAQREASQMARRRLTIGADTVVSAQGRIFGKPADSAQALEMLRFLSGRSHCVHTGVCLVLSQGGETLARHAFSEKSEVRFHNWPEDVLMAYAEINEPLDKAGAYAIQGQGAFLMQSLNGSASNVIGLPLAALAARLLRMGLIEPRQTAIWTR